MVRMRLRSMLRRMAARASSWGQFDGRHRHLMQGGQRFGDVAGEDGPGLRQVVPQGDGVAVDVERLVDVLDKRHGGHALVEQPAYEGDHLTQMAHAGPGDLGDDGCGHQLVDAVGLVS
jgi:hypothetical protein